MAQYLRYFTTVGDQQTIQWDDEELHVASEELSPATGQFPTTLTFRDSLRRLYSSERFQVHHNFFMITKCIGKLCNRGWFGSVVFYFFIFLFFQVAVVCLVILDAIFVLAELLIDLSIIELEHGHIAPEVRSKFVIHL